MHVVGLIIIAAMGAGLIFQDRKIQRLKAQRRIDRAKFKGAQLTMGQHDRVSMKEVENLRRSCREEAAAARKERQLKHAFRRNCEAMKSQLDDKMDEIESLRSALESANGTIRAMMEDRASGGAGIDTAMEELSHAARAFREAARGAGNG